MSVMIIICLLSISMSWVCSKPFTDIKPFCG